MAPLPSFERPPVFEVALAVQFEPVEPLLSSDLAGMRAILREEYPAVRELPPLPPLSTALDRSIEFEILSAAIVPRYWFVSSDGTHLVQLQSDRLAVNWRRADSNPYPRFDTIRPRFVATWENFVAHLGSLGYPAPTPQIAEVTYVNAIEAAADTWERASELTEVFAPWSGELTEAIPAELVTATLNLQFALSGADGNLTATVVPASHNETGRAAFMFTLTSRGQVQDRSFEGALAFLDVGHEAIVRTFAALTTPKMHTYWGRQP